MSGPGFKERLIGAWTLVAADSVQSDGSRTAVFGADPRGSMIFTSDGQFSLIQTRGDLPKLAANSRDHGTADENRAVVQGSIAYFGTYSVDEAGKVIALRLGGSTFANLLGAGEHKRIVLSLTPDELRFVNPGTPSGATLEVSWKRAR